MGGRSPTAARHDVDALRARSVPRAARRGRTSIARARRQRRHAPGSSGPCRARSARDRPDVLFAPGYTAPLTAPAPMVLTIHDVSFFAHPEWFSCREGTRRRLLTAWSARRARVVLTDSVFSKSEIVATHRARGTRVRVIPLGIGTARVRHRPHCEPRDGANRSCSTWARCLHDGASIS